jgi:hypothetical protein
MPYSDSIPYHHDKENGILVDLGQQHLVLEGKRLIHSLPRHRLVRLDREPSLFPLCTSHALAAHDPLTPGAGCGITRHTQKENNC